MNGATIVPLYYRAGEVLWQVFDSINGGALFTGSHAECEHFLTTYREF
jgi:hypothetical protein